MMGRSYFLYLHKYTQILVRGRSGQREYIVRGQLQNVSQRGSNYLTKGNFCQNFENLTRKYGYFGYKSIFRCNNAFTVKLIAFKNPKPLLK